MIKELLEPTFRKQTTQELYAWSIADWRCRIDSPFMHHSHSLPSRRENGLNLLLPFVSGKRLFYRLLRDGLPDADRSILYTADLLCGTKYLLNQPLSCGALEPRSILVNCLGHSNIVDYPVFLSKRVTEARLSSADEAGNYGFRVIEWALMIT